MKLLRMHSALALTMAGALAFGCSGGDDDGDTGTIRDSGPGSTGRDGGFPDGGGGPVCGDGICQDGMDGRPDGNESFINCSADCMRPDFCPDGTEGCECESSFTPGDTAIGQDTCMDADNVCVPWDVFSERGTDVMVPNQTCAKTCTTDTDCGMTEDGDPRFCVNMDFQGASAPVGRVCVDRLAGIDEFCGGSKNTEVLVNTMGAQVLTGDEQVGCAGDAVCRFNLFDTLNPDEGACVQPCGRAGDAACPTEYPYCNNIGLGVGTSTAGVCSVGRLGFGSLSNWTEDPDKAGLTTFCDADAPGDIVVLDLNVINIPAFLCVEECFEGGTTPDEPCVSTDATNPVECRVLNAETGSGVCVHGNADSFPDNCGGDGAFGNGRGEWGVQFGQTDPIPANWCVDRLNTLLAVSSFNSMGMIGTQGDNCGSGLDQFRCPEPTFCAGDGQGGGLCLTGCSLIDDPTYCEDAHTMLGLGTTNAGCVMTGTSTVVGLCGAD